jgi:hypothetical protein
MHTEQPYQHAEELRRESKELREYSDQLRRSLHLLLRQSEELRKQLHLRLAQALEQGFDDAPHQEHVRQSRSTDDVA